MKVLVKGQSQVFNKPALTLISLAITSTLLTSSALADIQLSGEIKQGALIVGKTSAKNIVTFDSKTLLLSENGDYVFGFDRDDEASHQLVITFPNGTKEQKTLTPAKRDYKIQRIEGIAKKIMNPNPKAVARAKKDGKIGRAHV